DSSPWRVSRRVGRYHHVVVLEVDVGEVRDHDRRHRRVVDGVAPDLAHVLVSRDGPEPGPVRLVVPVDGRVVAQPAKLLVRLAARERRRIQQVDVHAGGISNNPSTLSMVACSAGVTVLAAAATALAIPTNQPPISDASSFGSLRNADAALPRSASDASTTCSRFATRCWLALCRASLPRAPAAVPAGCGSAGPPPGGGAIVRALAAASFTAETGPGSPPPDTASPVSPRASVAAV